MQTATKILNLMVLLTVFLQSRVALNNKYRSFIMGLDQRHLDSRTSTDAEKVMESLLSSETDSSKRISRRTNL